MGPECLHLAPDKVRATYFNFPQYFSIIRCAGIRPSDSDTAEHCPNCARRYQKHYVETSIQSVYLHMKTKITHKNLFCNQINRRHKLLRLTHDAVDQLHC